MCDDDAVNRTDGGNGYVIDNPVNRIAQEFETGNEREIEFTAHELHAKRRGIIEHNVSRPTMNERSGVEIFDATDSQRFRRLDGVIRDLPIAQPFGIPVYPTASRHVVFSPYHIRRRPAQRPPARRR